MQEPLKFEKELGIRFFKECILKFNQIENLDKEIVYVNDAFFKLSDYTKNDLIGKPYATLKHYNLSEEEQKAVQAVYPQKISEAEPKNYGGVKDGTN